MIKDYLGAVVDCKKALEIDPNIANAKGIVDEAKRHL